MAEAPRTHYRCRGMVDAPRLSICEFTTLPASFDDDLIAYRAAGVQGIGVCEFKIAEDGAAAAKLRKSGLRATHCVPVVPSILPLEGMEGPEEPEARVEALCASLRELAQLEPACCVFLTGPLGGRDEAEGRAIVREGIAAVAAAAQEAGVRVGLEPAHPSQRNGFSFVNTIPDALDLLEEAGAGSVGIMFDAWHLWDSPGLEAHIREHVDRIVGVHVADRREPTRSDFDRVFPGDGLIDLGPILRTLDESGYDGWYDIEIFSDNGAFGERFPDSLWDVEARELARRARESFLRVWETR